MRYLVVYLLACLLVCLAASAWAVQYEIRDLGVLTGYASYYPADINDRGEVVGTAYTRTHQACAFVWDAVNGIRLIAADYAYGINNNGVAVIHRSTYTAFWDSINGVRYTDGYVQGLCINDLGYIAGSNGYQGCVWDATNGIRTFDPLPGYDSAQAHAINNLGQVSGYSQSTSSLVHAFFWDNTTGIQDIGCLEGYYSSFAWGMNDLGQVVGHCRNSNQTDYCAYIWDSINGIQSLGIRGYARDINNSGLVVGDSSIGAFVWNKSSGVQYLPSLTPGRGSTAEAINKQGIITGKSTAADGQWHAVVWTPVPEPSSFFVLIGGLGSIGLVARRRIGI